MWPTGALATATQIPGLPIRLITMSVKLAHRLCQLHPFRFSTCQRRYPSQFFCARNILAKTAEDRVWTHLQARSNSIVDDRFDGLPKHDATAHMPAPTSRIHSVFVTQKTAINIADQGDLWRTEFDLRQRCVKVIQHRIHQC